MNQKDLYIYNMSMNEKIVDGVMCDMSTSSFTSVVSPYNCLSVCHNASMRRRMRNPKFCSGESRTCLACVDVQTAFFLSNNTIADRIAICTFMCSHFNQKCHPPFHFYQSRNLYLINVTIVVDVNKMSIQI